MVSLISLGLSLLMVSKSYAVPNMYSGNFISAQSSASASAYASSSANAFGSVPMSPFPPSAPAAFQTPSNLLYHKGSGKCLDGNGKDLYLLGCGAQNPFQQWISTPEGLLRHQQSNKCLDGNGDKFYFNECQNGNPWQKWHLTQDGLLQHVQSQKCVDPGLNGDVPIFTPCLPGASSLTFSRQPFQQPTDGWPLALVHGNSRLCMDSNGQNLYFHQCSNANPFQQWTFTKDGMLRHQQSQRCLTVSNNNFVIANCDNSVARFETTSSNMVHIVRTPKCLDGNGQQFYQMDCQIGNQFQIWFQQSL